MAVRTTRPPCQRLIAQAETKSMVAFTKAAWRARIGLRVQRPGLLPRQVEPAHQLAHMRGVVRHTPALLDLLARLQQFQALSPLAPRLARPAPPASAPPFASRPAALADLSEVDRAVRQDPRRCSASLHRAAPAVPCQPAAPPPPAAGPRVRPRSPACACRRTVLLPPRQPPQLRRRYVRADRQRSATHRVLPHWVGRNQNHLGPRRLNSRLINRNADRYHTSPRTQPVALTASKGYDIASIRRPDRHHHARAK